MAIPLTGCRVSVVLSFRTRICAYMSRQPSLAVLCAIGNRTGALNQAPGTTAYLEFARGIIAPKGDRGMHLERSVLSRVIPPAECHRISPSATTPHWAFQTQNAQQFSYFEELEYENS